MYVYKKREKELTKEGSDDGRNESVVRIILIIHEYKDGDE